MIHISIKEVYRLGRFDLSIYAEGHAGYAKPGQPDLVCAGASTLLCTMEACLRDLEEQGGVRITQYARDAVTGLMHIEASAVTRAETISDMVRFLLTGCMMLESEYPEHVWVEYGVDEEL